MVGAANRTVGQPSKQNSSTARKTNEKTCPTMRNVCCATSEIRLRVSLFARCSNTSCSTALRTTPYGSAPHICIFCTLLTVGLWNTNEGGTMDTRTLYTSPMYHMAEVAHPSLASLYPSPHPAGGSALKERKNHSADARLYYWRRSSENARLMSRCL